MKNIFLIAVLLAYQHVKAQTAETLYFKGVRFAEKEDYPTAIHYFTKAIQKHEFFTEAYYNRALANSRMKQYASSILDYSKAIDLRPHFAIAYNNRGADHLEMKLCQCNCRLLKSNRD